jgi:hypothetical protein
LVWRQTKAANGGWRLRDTAPRSKTYECLSPCRPRLPQLPLRPPLTDSVDNIGNPLNALNNGGCLKRLNARLNERLTASGKHPLKVFDAENCEWVGSVWH